MTGVREPRTFGIWLPTDVPISGGDITISNLSDDHRELVPHGELWVPRSFTATVDRQGLPLLELDVALVQRRFRCVQLRASARSATDYIETKHLRDAGVVALVKEATALVAYVRVELEDETDVDWARSAFTALADLEADPVDLDDIQVGDYFRYSVLTPLIAGDRAAHGLHLPFATDALATAAPGRRRGTVTDEEVADVYRLAYAQNQPVIVAVADRFKWHRQTAKNRIRAARKQGLLPETIPGSRCA